MELSELEKQQKEAEAKQKKALAVIEKLQKAVRSVYATEDGYFMLKNLVRASGLHASSESLFKLDREKRRDAQVVQDFIKNYILSSLEQKQLGELLGDVFTPDKD